MRKRCGSPRTSTDISLPGPPPGADGRGAFAVWRANWQSRPIEEALLDPHIPYRPVGDAAYYTCEKFADAGAYLTQAIDPADPVAVERVANKPARGLGPGARSRILAVAGGPCGGGDLIAAGARSAGQRGLAPATSAGAFALARAYAAWREPPADAPAERFLSLSEDAACVPYCLQA